MILGAKIFQQIGSGHEIELFSKLKFTKDTMHLKNSNFHSITRHLITWYIENQEL
jgi:hypothetical protein